MGAPPDLRPRAIRGVPLPHTPTTPSSLSTPSTPFQSPSTGLPKPITASPSLPLPLRKPPNPLSSPLPSLRILLHPFPGLGVDMRLPLSRRTRCYMQLDSFFNAASQIRIGLHPRNYPGVRLQLSPIPRLSIRVPFRIGGAKFLQIGACCGVGNGNEGSLFWKFGHGKPGLWAGFTVEIWRYTTGSGMIDEKVRSGVRELLQNRDKGRQSRLDDIAVDPRERDQILDIMKEVLSERRKMREERTGIPSGSVVGKDGGKLKDM